MLCPASLRSHTGIDSVLELSQLVGFVIIILKLVSYSEFFSIPKVGIAVQNLSCCTLYSVHSCSLSRAGVTLASSKSGFSFQAVSLQSIFYDAIVTFFSLKF